MDRLFINTTGCSPDWIMGKIANDLKSAADKNGIPCRTGRIEDYEGEEICYHLMHDVAIPFPEAKHNSVFYTHLNDKLKEHFFKDLIGKFDSYICMSPEDAQFMIELGFDKNKVFGKVLPVRNTYVKPISIGIFSACYIDGRKNEQWLIDFCKDNEDARFVNFVFIGKGWGRVVEALAQYGCSSEWHNVSRSLPYEYQFQQNKLASLNYYMYMGMDGGAMGSYDAYAQDVPLCITWDGFHKALPHIDYVFDNKKTFFEQMSIITSLQRERFEFFSNNNIENYFKWLNCVWNGTIRQTITDEEKSCISYNSVVEKKREQYYPLTVQKFKNFINHYRFLWNEEKKLNKNKKK